MPVIAVHTDFVADVVETQARHGTAAMATHHLKALRTGGIDCICEHVIGDTFEALCFPTERIVGALRPDQPYAPSSLKHGLHLLASFLRDVEQCEGRLRIATTAADIRECADEGVLAVVLCFQGTNPVEGDPILLDVFYRLGIRILGITTNHDNAAGRSQVGRNGGLTQIGNTLVARANELGMVVDVSHLSDHGIRDVLEIASGPIIASNSNTRRHHDIPRNLSDEMIERIAASGGIVGVHANGDLITHARPVTLDHWADHVFHIVDLVGIDHAAIGPDLVDETMYPAERYRSLMAGRDHFHAPYPQGLETHADLPRFTDVLQRRGINDDGIAKVLGGNALRVFETVWGR